MKNLSTEAKVGLALIAVSLVAVIWFASGTRLWAPPPPVALVTPSSRSERVQERLSQLREERQAALEGRQGGMQQGDNAVLDRAEALRELKERPLPTQPAGHVAAPPTAVGARAPRSPLPAALADADDDLDFDNLKKTALKDDDPENRIVAVWLLASLDDEPVVPVLTQALSDSDPEVRLAAIESLSDFSDEMPIDALSVALDDPDPEIRFEAVSIAADIDDDRARPLIEKAMQDPDEDVRALAEGVNDLATIDAGAPTPAAP